MDRSAPAATPAATWGAPSTRADVDHVALALGTRRVSAEEHAFFARAYLAACPGHATGTHGTASADA